MPENIRDESGSALVIVVAVLIVCSIIVVAIIGAASSDALQTKADSNVSEAYYLSRSAVEMTAHAIKQKYSELNDMISQIPELSKSPDELDILLCSIELSENELWNYIPKAEGGYTHYISLPTSTGAKDFAVIVNRYDIEDNSTPETEDFYITLSCTAYCGNVSSKSSLKFQASRTLVTGYGGNSGGAYEYALAAKEKILFSSYAGVYNGTPGFPSGATDNLLAAGTGPDGKPNVTYSDIYSENPYPDEAVSKTPAPAQEAYMPYYSWIYSGNKDGNYVEIEYADELYINAGFEYISQLDDISGLGASIDGNGVYRYVNLNEDMSIFGYINALNYSLKIADDCSEDIILFSLENNDLEIFLYSIPVFYVKYEPEAQSPHVYLFLPNIEKLTIYGNTEFIKDGFGAPVHIFAPNADVIFDLYTKNIYGSVYAKNVEVKGTEIIYTAPKGNTLNMLCENLNGFEYYINSIDLSSMRWID